VNFNPALNRPQFLRTTGQTATTLWMAACIAQLVCGATSSAGPVADDSSLARSAAILRDARAWSHSEKDARITVTPKSLRDRSVFDFNARGTVAAALVVASQASVAADPQATFATSEHRVAAATNTPGCVAFWDFVKREQNGARRFTAHVPPGATNNFPLDAGNYIKDFWREGREATYADFPLLDRGPFGQAIRIRPEEDPTFRPFLFVPRERLNDSHIDIKGAGKSVSVVVWAIRESGNHALAGIWHEGTVSGNTRSLPG
jgi:hypothetical protein